MELLATITFQLLIATTALLIVAILSLKTINSIKRNSYKRRKKISRDALCNYLFEEKTVKKKSILLEDLVEVYKLSEKDSQDKIRSIYKTESFFKNDLKNIRRKNTKRKIEALRRITLFKMSINRRLIMQISKKEKNPHLINELLLTIDKNNNNKMQTLERNQVKRVTHRLYSKGHIKYKINNKGIDSQDIENKIILKLKEKQFPYVYMNIQKIKDSLSEDLISELLKTNNYYIQSIVCNFYLSKSNKEREKINITDEMMLRYMKFNEEYSDE